MSSYPRKQIPPFSPTTTNPGLDFTRYVMKRYTDRIQTGTDDEKALDRKGEK